MIEIILKTVILRANLPKGIERER